MATYEMTTKVEIAEDFGDFQEIELKIIEASREAGRGLMQKILLDYETSNIEKRRFRKKTDGRRYLRPYWGR